MTDAPKRGRGRPRKHPLQPITPEQFVSEPEILPPAVKELPVKMLNPIDPSLIEPWPRNLPVEIALQTGPIDKLVEAYRLTGEEWEALSANPDFQAEVDAQREALKTEGMSFKMKARLQAEEMLRTSWQMVHNPDTPAPQRVDLIKTTFRVAGYDNKEGTAIGNAVGLSINLILGDK